MNKKKTIITAIVLLLVLLIGGLFAYYTDTDEVDNVIKIGNVDIELTEPTWTSDAQGQALATAGVTPGQVIKKDPTITNTGSNNAFVFLKVTVPQESGADVFTIGTLDSNWKELSSASSNGVHVYYYGTTSALSELAPNAVTTAFTTVTLPANTTISNVTKTINVKAYAIQSSNLSSNAIADVWSQVSSL